MGGQTAQDARTRRFRLRAAGVRVAHDLGWVTNEPKEIEESKWSTVACGVCRSQFAGSEGGRKNETVTGRQRMTGVLHTGCGVRHTLTVSLARCKSSSKGRVRGGEWTGRADVVRGEPAAARCAVRQGGKNKRTAGAIMAWPGLLCFAWECDTTGRRGQYPVTTLVRGAAAAGGGRERVPVSGCAVCLSPDAAPLQHANAGRESPAVPLAAADSHSRSIGHARSLAALCLPARQHSALYLSALPSKSISSRLCLAGTHQVPAPRRLCCRAPPGPERVLGSGACRAHRRKCCSGPQAPRPSAPGPGCQGQGEGVHSAQSAAPRACVRAHGLADGRAPCAGMQGSRPEARRSTRP